MPPAPPVNMSATSLATPYLRNKNEMWTISFSKPELPDPLMSQSRHDEGEGEMTFDEIL